MILKLDEFKAVVAKIKTAVDNDRTAANLELLVKDRCLFLNVTNREYFVSVRFPVETEEAFHATVDANQFLNLVAGMNAGEITLATTDSALVINFGKSSYKLGLIFENDKLLILPRIQLTAEHVNTEMSIEYEVLQSILNVNGREVQKAKHLDVNELQRYYYLDSDASGNATCFTFTTGACVNSFTLEKPIKLLLTDKVVKLFKLFNSDVWMTYGHSTNSDNTLQPIVIFQTERVYVASRLLNDETYVNKIKAPCEAMKNLIKEHYDHSLVLSSSELSAAISRLLMFYKNSSAKADLSFVPAIINFTNTELTISDMSGDNHEVITIENGSTTPGGYSMGVNLIDLKSVLDSCKNEHITMNCGNHKSIIICRANISNVIAETRTKE